MPRNLRPLSSTPLLRFPQIVQVNTHDIRPRLRQTQGHPLPKARPDPVTIATLPVNWNASRIMIETSFHKTYFNADMGTSSMSVKV